MFRNIWLVIKHDIGMTLRQRSFWLLTLLMPVLLMGANAYAILTREGAIDLAAGGGDQDAPVTDPADLPPIGLVDDAGLIADLPPGLPADLFLPFADREAALAALEAGEVVQYVHVPADYLATGRITVYDEDFYLLASGAGMGVAFGGSMEWLLPYVLDYNLTGDPLIHSALGNPVPGALTEYHALRPPDESEAQSQELGGVVSGIMPYIYYFLLIMGGSYMLRAVAAEKENRTAEVLLLSLDPRELMFGKLIAMSVVMLLQVAVWVGGGILVLNKGADLLNVTRFDFPPGFVLWAVLFLILGYLLYASIMAAAGALAPNAREGNQVIWLLIIPLMPTLMFGQAFLEDPNGALAVGLSLFPFSAPGAMVTRLAISPVPLWQVLLSLAGLAATTYLFVALSARFFRAGNLLSDASFNWRRLATGWRKPA